jgi:hypothetical protein
MAAVLSQQPRRNDTQRRRTEQANGKKHRPIITKAASSLAQSFRVVNNAQFRRAYSVCGDREVDRDLGLGLNCIRALIVRLKMPLLYSFLRRTGQDRRTAKHM